MGKENAIKRSQEAVGIYVGSIRKSERVGRDCNAIGTTGRARQDWDRKE